jgi:N-acetylmuramoyl-L-alanine amidase
MKTDKANGLNIVRFNKNEIKDTQLIMCRGKGETLEEMYNRLSSKPDIIFNAGFFNFVDGWTLGAAKSYGSIIRDKSAVKYGFALCGKGDSIHFKTVDKSFSEVAKDYDWAIESSPLLLPQFIGNQLDKGIVNGRHMRTAFGLNEKTLEYQIFVTDSSKKMTYPEMITEAKKHGVTHFLGFDGGGSSLCLVKGQRVNTQPERRKISNAIAIWLKNENEKPIDNTPKEEVPVTNKPKLVIDAGHGGTDPGATFDGFREKDFTLVISLYQYERFKQLGVPVALTRDSDISLDSTTRTAIIKKSGAKYCISNHINAGGGRGVETIYSIFSDGKLANKLLDAIVAAGQYKRRAFSRQGANGKDYYYMHRDTGKVDTTIIEYAFIDNNEDMVNLINNWKTYAEAVVKVITEELGYKYSPPESVGDNPKPKESVLYRVQVGAFSIRENAEKLAEELKMKGYSPIVKEE